MPSKPRRGKTNPEALIRWEREIECLKLRKQGVNWDTIVEKLGYASRGHGHKQLMSFLKDYPMDDVVEYRELEILRIEQKMLQLEPRCEQGDPRAIEVWAKLSERLSKFRGGDAPERKEVRVLTEDVFDEAYRKLEEQLAEQERQKQQQQT